MSVQPTGVNPNAYDASDSAAEDAPPPAVAAPPPSTVAPQPLGAPAAGSGGSWTFDPTVPSAGGIDPPAWMRLPPPDPNTQASDHIKVECESALNGLAAAAANNTTGPEARLVQTIKGLEKDALAAIEPDEAKLKKMSLIDSPERRALEDKIDARMRNFDFELARATFATADEIKAQHGGDASVLDKFKSMLPDYLRQCLDRGGIVIPGVPGAFMPRQDNGTFKPPTGLDYKVPF
jgi:hypothetical protein